MIQLWANRPVLAPRAWLPVRETDWLAGLHQEVLLGWGSPEYVPPGSVTSE